MKHCAILCNCMRHADLVCTLCLRKLGDHVTKISKNPMRTIETDYGITFHFTSYDLWNSRQKYGRENRWEVCDGYHFEKMLEENFNG